MQVEQIDRNAAADAVALTTCSKDDLAKEFALHRLAERRRVVAFLRSGKGDDLLFVLTLASAIEAGEHMK